MNSQTYRILGIAFDTNRHHGRTEPGFFIAEPAEPPPVLPSLEKYAEMAITDALLELEAAVANGIPAAPNRPAAPIPNGKATSPYVERSNPMGQGAAQTVSSKDPKAAAQAASDMRNVVRRKLTGYVGFANLPNQWHRKSVRKGFNFNVMVVGEFQIRAVTPLRIRQV
jgi:hypothetical protein